MRQEATATNEARGLQDGHADALDATWRAWPRIAATVRVVALCGPVAISVAVVYATARVVGPPTGSLGLHLGWLAVLSAAATVSLVVAGRLSRRLLPLAALLRLSLVFPDGAPSRFRTAFRTGAVSTLEERLAAAREGASGRTPVEAAQLLLELVAHLDEHDPLTRGHSERVRAYAQSVGRELGLDHRQLDLLNWAALLHDVGKLVVPHEILAKSGRPTEEEWELLRGHPAAGAELASPLRPWLGEWYAAIEEHHERWDGAGYPRRLSGTEISLAGRIVAVADVFDVITSARSYKGSASLVEARRELLRCAGTQFDPDVVRALLAISVHQGRLAAPLAWLAHVAVLARLPVTQAASGLSVGAAAVAVGVGVGVTGHPAERVTMPPPGRAAAARPTEARPIAKLDPRPLPARPLAERAHSAARTRPARPRVNTDGPAAAGSPTPVTGSTPTDTSPARAPKTHAEAAPHEPPLSSPQPKPIAKPLVDPPPVVAPPAPVPKPPVVPLPDVTPVADDLADEVASVTSDVVSLSDPATPLAEDVAAVVDDVTSITTPPPPPPDSPPPTSPPRPEEDQQAPAGSLLDGVLSLLTGLTSPLLRH